MRIYASAAELDEVLERLVELEEKLAALHTDSASAQLPGALGEVKYIIEKAQRAAYYHAAARWAAENGTTNTTNA